MNNKTIYRVGDQVQTADGRMGVVISVDRDPIRQGPNLPQLIVVRFQDQSTTIGNAEDFKAVNEKVCGNVDS